MKVWCRVEEIIAKHWEMQRNRESHIMQAHKHVSSNPYNNLILNTIQLEGTSWDGRAKESVSAGDSGTG